MPDDDLTARLRAATELLESVAVDRSPLDALSDEERTRFLNAAGDVYCPDVEERRQRAKARRRQARAEKLARDEAVLADTSGALAEGTGSNVFVVVDGVLVTPSLATGCLPGITRGLVYELVPVVERDDLTLDDLRQAGEAFLTSSTRDVQPIASVDGVGLRSAPGPVTAEVRASFAALQSSTSDP